MAASGSVSTSIGGSVMTFTDTGTYSLPIVSKVLTIYDYKGQLLTTINMGNSLTATYDILADGYFAFFLSVTDQSGNLQPFEYDYVSIGYYIAAALNRAAANECNCNANWDNYDNAESMITSAVRYAISGYAETAQNLINDANTLINTP